MTIFPTILPKGIYNTHCIIIIIRVVGERQGHLSQLYGRRVVRKARVIVDENSHVLAKCYETIPSGR